MTGENKSLWEKTKTGGKAGFDKLWGYADKLGKPVNRLSNKLGSEAFWPTSLDKEADKAARILRSFCKDGFYQEETVTPEAEGPKQKQRVIKHIPSEVIKNAKGLAIFTTMRTGLWVSGAGGSGIVIARKSDGTWSPPSGILLHTAGLGFLIGVDIYDCVLVLNTQEALDAFTKVRCTLGSEISAAAGPVGMGGVLESEVHTRQAPIFTYLKSRGFYAGVQIDGTVVVERTDENERFYGSKLAAKEILSGRAYPPKALTTLLTTLNAAQGDEVNEQDLPSEPPPADYEVVEEGHVFGIPDKDDPDPFGVQALNKEGYQVTDASTHTRPADSEFEFHPRQDSPAYATFNRQELASSNPASPSHSKGHQRFTSVDHATQTDFDQPTDSKPAVDQSSPAVQTGDAEPSSMQPVTEPQEQPSGPEQRGPPPALPPRNAERGVPPETQQPNT